MRPGALWLIPLVACACAAGCKRTPHRAAVARDGAPAAAAVDWARCTRALADRSPGWDLAALRACPVCDFAVILHWQRPAARGGPSRRALRAALDGCHAFCTGAARERFMGTVDEARGVARSPWRYLGQMCQDQVSATGDAKRFMSAAYFAFDRLARAVAAHGGDAARALAAIDLPLPPLTVSGIGPALPAQPHGLVALAPGQLALTIVGAQLFLGHLPHAHLDAHGVHLVAGDAPYPGTAVTDLAAAAAAARGQPLAVLALAAAPAAPLADLAARAPDLPLRLVAARSTAIDGWPELGILPVDLVGARPAGAARTIALDGPPPPAAASGATGSVVIAIGEHAKIADLAVLLHALEGAAGRVTLVRAGASKDRLDAPRRP